MATSKNGLPLHCKSAADVLKAVEQYNVRFVRLWFTDVLGFLKSFAITTSELPEALEDGMGFDGSSIQGYARIDESDMIAMPDPTTFQILPWRSKEDDIAVGRMFCDVLKPGGEPYIGDPRGVLKRTIAKANEMGFTNYYCGPELEYFYFKSAEAPETLDKGGYFDLTPLDVASDLRRQSVLALEAMGIRVEYSHHEVGPSQHEIDMRYADAVTMADNAMTFRLVVKEIALANGVYGTFMPKPIAGVNGSGMHVHMSLFKGDRNAFFDAKDPLHLSKDARGFIAGILKHVPELCIVINQWVNSYRRLIPGYEAPCYISWGRRNRSALVRVPQYKPGKERATRIEVRCPDPACNPYLAFAVMLAAGLKGIKENYELCKPVEEDVFHLSPERRVEMGIPNLPGTLGEAIAVAEKSEVLRETLGEHIFEKLIENKKIEWQEYCAFVSNYDIERYLPIL